MTSNRRARSVSGAPRHQDEAAVPHGFELGPRHQRRPLAIRRLDEDLVLARLAEQQKPAVAQGGDSRQGRAGQPVPSRLRDSLAFRPSCRAQRSISGTPIASVPN